MTAYVHGPGLYTVGDIKAQTKGSICENNMAYAGWTMLIIFEKAGLPQSQLNICTHDFRLTAPAMSYTSRMRCTYGKNRMEARTTIVTLNAASGIGEYFYINGIYIGDNEFNGSTAPNLDIREYDDTSLVKRGISMVIHTFVTYEEDSKFGNTVENLVAPVRVLRYKI